MKNQVKIIDKDFFFNIFRLVLIIYTSLLLPKLNNNHLKLFNNNIIQLVILSLLVYLANFDITSAVILMIAFFSTMYYSKEINSSLIVNKKEYEIMNIANNKERFDNNTNTNYFFLTENLAQLKNEILDEKFKSEITQYFKSMNNKTGDVKNMLITYNDYKIYNTSVIINSLFGNRLYIKTKTKTKNINELLLNLEPGKFSKLKLPDIGDIKNSLFEVYSDKKQMSPTRIQIELKNEYVMDNIFNNYFDLNLCGRKKKKKRKRQKL